MIGVLTTSYPRTPADQAGSFVRDRVMELQRAGHDVEVIAAADAAGARVENDHGVYVHRVESAVASAPPLFYTAGAPEVLEGREPSAWLVALRFSIGLLAAATRLAPRWTSVESHWLVPCGLCADLAAGALPRRAFAHSGDVALLERLPCGRSLARRLAASGATLSFVSADLRDRFLMLAGDARTPSRCEVVALAIDRESFTTASANERASLRRDLGIDRPTVLGVGRLVPIKGFDTLIRAVAQIHGTRPSVVILGEGPERGNLVALAQRLDVDLRLHGTVPRSAVASWMRAANVFGHPARRLANGRTEGSPVAVRQAMAVGLPVVATNTGGLPGLQTASRAITLVPPDDAPRLSQALKVALAAARS